MKPVLVLSIAFFLLGVWHLRECVTLLFVDWYGATHPALTTLDRVLLWARVVGLMLVLGSMSIHWFQPR